MFVQVLSECLGMEPELFGGVGYRAGCFLRLPMAFSYLAATVFIRFFDFRKSRPPSALPESPARSSLSRYAICADKNEVLPL